MNKGTNEDMAKTDLQKLTVKSLLKTINEEDKTVAEAVELAIPQISKLVEVIVEKLKEGGRLFYIGAGTSGRLGILDASECPPTFGVSPNKVIGIIAGGDKAIRNGIEFAEDDKKMAWMDLRRRKVSKKDIVIGIAASGTTPYVVNGLKDTQLSGIFTGCISCKMNSALAEYSDYPIEVEVGPEVIRGSTRMKAGTAQKMILNMISTTVMIKLGKTLGNNMVDMQLTNNKLIDRGAKMIMKYLGLDYQAAKTLLIKQGSVRNAIDNFENKK